MRATLARALVCALVASPVGLPMTPGPDRHLSVAADHAAGAVPARRQRRRGDPAGGGEGRRGAQAADRHRQPLRRRRQHRGAGHQAGDARRLHAVPHQHGRDVGQSDPDAGHERRSGQGLPADHADHLVSAHPGGAARQPGEDRRRPRGAGQDQARRLELRLAGRRLRRADPRRDVQGPARRADGARALPGRGARRHRHHGRPARFPVHVLHLDRRAGQGRQASHRRHRRTEAHRRRARTSRPWRRRAIPGLDLEMWHGMVAPAGTPAPIVKRLNAEFIKATRSPDILRIVEPQATDVFVTTPEEFGKRIAADTERLGQDHPRRRHQGASSACRRYGRPSLAKSPRPRARSRRRDAASASRPLR